MAATYLEFDLATEVEQLHREPGWSTGHNAKTLLKYDDLRLVLIALRAGAQIPAHQTDGRVTIHTIAGLVQVRAEGRTFELRTGRLVAFEHGVRHDVEALEESALLLTIAWPKR
jgi:quercetin dioxygenase-like cupin family protein